MNLKQSRFNSSCLSAPGQRQAEGSALWPGPISRPRARAGGETERTGAEMLQRTHHRTQTPLYLFNPPPLALPSLPRQFLHFSVRVFFPPSVVYKLSRKSYIFSPSRGVASSRTCNCRLQRRSVYIQNICVVSDSSRVSSGIIVPFPSAATSPRSKLNTSNDAEKVNE